jgi:alpha-D-ribose 1-methylphosphonate 5-triphosphate synthase subunit PhnG
MHFSEIVAEAELAAIRTIADRIAAGCEVRVIREPSPATVMVRNVDPLEKTPFHLGEIYVTDCEVEVDGELGYSCVLGSERDRALYGAMIDAVMHTESSVSEETMQRLDKAGCGVLEARAAESSRVAATAVDFRTE